jgi:uncharacterized protein
MYNFGKQTGEDNGKLYVRTMLHAGKVKRIRNNGRVRIAPCNGRGRLSGEWIEARALLIDAPAEAAKIDGLLDRKYGWQKRLLSLFNKRETQWATISIEV